MLLGSIALQYFLNHSAVSLPKLIFSLKMWFIYPEIVKNHLLYASDIDWKPLFYGFKVAIRPLPLSNRSLLFSTLKIILKKYRFVSAEEIHAKTPYRLSQISFKRCVECWENENRVWMPLILLKWFVLKWQMLNRSHIILCSWYRAS